MKVIIKSNNIVINFLPPYVQINNINYAKYTTSLVSKCNGDKTLGKLYRKDGNFCGACMFNPSLKIKANMADHTLRNMTTNEVVATFEGSSLGAIASYITYVYLTYTKNSSPQNNASLQTITANTNPQYVQSADKVVIPNSELYAQKEFIKPEEKAEYIKQIPKDDYRVPDPPRHQLPSIPTGDGGGSGGGGSGCGCLAAILGVLGFISALSLIPQSWEDLTTYIPEGDTGITICFFSALIGGILAVIISVFSKKPKFLSCMQTFLVTCAIGIVVNAFILIKDGVEFTGFFLFDIPLSIFAPILGCFQFALPIGIVTAIICGIACSFKNN